MIIQKREGFGLDKTAERPEKRRQTHNINTMSDEPAEQLKPVVARGDYMAQWEHIKHLHLVRSTEDFIVVIDREGYLDWETTPGYDAQKKERSPQDRELQHELLGDIAVAESYPCDGQRDSVSHHYRRLLGEAIVFCLEYNFSTSRKVLANAEKYIKSRSEEISRRWYLTASACTATVFAFVGALIWIFRTAAEQMLGQTGMWLAIACSAGAVGALFSVIARSGDLKFDACAGRTLHNWEACSRIVAGAISALVVALAIQANLIFGTFASGGHMHVIVLLAALAAGTGERLASSIISKFEETHPSHASDINESTNQRDT
jgi:hypothetical protein